MLQDQPPKCPDDAAERWIWTIIWFKRLERPGVVRLFSCVHMQTEGGSVRGNMLRFRDFLCCA